MKNYFMKAHCHELSKGFSHTFQETTYFTPTFCDHCAGMVRNAFISKPYRAYSLTCPAAMQIYWNKRKEFNSHRICLEHQHGRRLIVLEHQYGCHDVMCIRSIVRNMKKVLVSFSAILLVVVSSDGSFFVFRSCLPPFPPSLPFFFLSFLTFSSFLTS